MEMSNQVALDYIAEHEAKGHHVDSRVKRRLAEGCPVVIEVIEDQDRFLQLLYHDNQKVSGFLTPYHQPRTLRDVVRRMNDTKLNFNSIAEVSDKIPPELHRPDWFNKCLDIYTKGLTFEDFGCLFLMDLVDEEQRWSPSAFSSIYDGTHRSLVLAWLLMNKEINFHPIKCFIFRPRPLNLD